MTFRGDDRAVTVQIGAVLLFGFLVVAMSMYQVTVVPSETKAAEFEHNQRVQADVLDLGSAVHRAAAGGVHPTTADLGVTYPRRTFFVNPPPARGSVETVAAGDGSLTVSNAAADAPEVGDYWSGDDRTFDTKSVVYRPGYNQYADAPLTAYGNTVAYNRFENGYVDNISDQTLVDGRRVSLVLVGGELSKGGTGARSITPAAVSAASRTATVRDGGGGNVTLTLPTRLSAETWRSVLASEMDGTGDGTNDRYVHAVRNVSEAAVAIEMEADATYDLRIAKVGFGSVPEPEPHYVVPVTATQTVAENGRQAVAFEVRDRYDNPVSGASVDLSLSTSGTLQSGGESGSSLSGLVTDEEGRVTATYAPGGADGTRNATVTARIASPASDAPADATEAAVDVSVVSAGGANGGGGDAAYDTTWNLSRIESQPGVESCDAETTTCVFDRTAAGSLELAADTAPTAVDASIDFSLNDTTAASVDRADDRTDGDGDASMRVDVDESGTFRAYVASGGSGDALTVRSVGGASSPLRYVGGSGTATGPDGSDTGGIAFELENVGASTVRVTGMRVNTSAAAGVRELSTGEGAFAREVFVNVRGPDGSENPGDGYLDGFFSGISTGTLYDLGREATLEASGTSQRASVTVYEFVDRNGRSVDTRGEEFEVTVRYVADGDEGTYTFTVRT